MTFSSPVPPRIARRAFTLVELLVVMAIIAIVIALVLPAIGGSRIAVRVTETKNFCTQLSNAVAAYVNDENKSPGYFSEVDMGGTANAPGTKGMSEAENVMLSLIGYQPPQGGPVTIVNPTTDASKNLSIDATLMGIPGKGSKQYFVPNKKFYVPQVNTTQQVAVSPYASSEGDVNQLPDLIDPFGTPILIWRQDDTYIKKPSTQNNGYEFASPDSSTRAKFYWTSNACFLKATSTGKKGVDQTDTNKGSWLGYGAGVNPPANVKKSLAGVLGSVSDPFRPSGMVNPPDTPRSGRGQIIIQSAGADGVYLGRNDKGGKQFTTTGWIDYRFNFAPNVGAAVGPTNQYTDKDGHPTNHDLLGDFDDIFTQAGN